MTKALTFHATVANGKIPDGIRILIAQAIAGLEGKRITISVAVAKKRRSLNQNAFYWGSVIPPVIELFAENGTDIDADQCHEYLKKNVMGVTEVIKAPDGCIHVVAGKSRALATVEWENNMEKIRAWAAQYGKAIPFPNEHLNGGEL